MGTWDSMYTALSGMNANALTISVVGDNLANLNTIGFKAGRATFQDILGQTLIGATGARRLGQGVALGSLDQLHSQGGFQATGSVTDMAISGNGFFVVRDASGGAEANYYTRAGQFLLDAEGNLVTPAGLRLQGYLADVSGAVGGAPADLNLGAVHWPGQVTSRAELELNLPLEAEPINSGAIPFDPTDPTTFHRQTNFQVYDSLGQAHTVRLYFTKSDNPGEWEWNATVDGVDVTPIGANQLLFDTEGNLIGSPISSLTFDPTNGATAGQGIELDFTGTTHNAGAFSVRDLSQDGKATGELESITLREDGTVTGTFSNGRTRDLARVALALFDSVQGLQRQGGNLWSRTPQSGEPLIAGAGDGGRGMIVASHLEGSNVDMTQEFVNLIAAQRGFQASSRTITTVDQLLNETVNLKR
jgi:flagellar hook protein FlgE